MEELEINLQDIPDDHEWGNKNCTCDMCLNSTIEEREELDDRYYKKLLNDSNTKKSFRDIS